MRLAAAATSDERDSSISSRETTLVSHHRDSVRSSAPTLSEHVAPEEELEPSEGRVSSVDDDPIEWCIDAAGEMHVMCTVELWIAITQGEIGADARVWREGMECWTRVDAMPELVCALTPADGEDPYEDEVEASGPIPLVRPKAVTPPPLPPLDHGSTSARTTRMSQWPAASALILAAGISAAAGLSDSPPVEIGPESLEPSLAFAGTSPEVSAHAAPAVVRAAWKGQPSGEAGRQRTRRATSGR